ncbi:MAG TPA: sulfatase [bacterium]|nr:sulfatase [bacterium]
MNIRLAAVFCVVTGLSLFLVDQTASFYRSDLYVPPLFAPLYLAMAIVVGLAGIFTASLVSRRGGGIRFLRFFAILGGAYLLFLLICQAWRWAMTGAWQVKDTSMVCLGLCLLALVRGWTRRGRPAGLKWTALGFCFWALLLAWLLRPPEPQLIPEDGHGWAMLLNALFVAALMGVVFQIRLCLKWRLRFDLAAAAVLLALSAGASMAIRTFTERIPASAPAVVAAAAGRPNIILIVWDTVRRDHLSVYGYERDTTPNLVEFSRQSMVYQNAVSVAAWTLPSHVSMFSGLYPRTHGSTNVPVAGRKDFMGFRKMPAEFPTLSEILSRNGYRCAGISANFAYAGKAVALNRGFEYFNDAPNPCYLIFSHCDLLAYAVDLVKGYAPESLLCPYLIAFPTADEVSKRALRWLDSVAPGGQPLFLFLNYMEAHGLSYPPQDLIHLFPGFQHDLLFTRSGAYTISVDENGKPDPRRQAHLVSQYDAEIFYLDSQFEQLLRELRKRGLSKNTIIILTSDHGEHFGDHNGILSHRYDVYNQLLYIPLIIKYPGGSPAGVNSASIENRSLFFMIQNMAGIKTTMDEHPWNAAEVYGENPHLPGHGNSRDGTLVYHRAFFFDKYSFIDTNAGGQELYDLQEDPEQTRNIIDLLPAIRRRGQELAETFTRTIKPYQEVEPVQAISPDELKKMKALGYIQ